MIHIWVESLKTLQLNQMNNISYEENIPHKKTNIFYEDFIGYYENKFSDKLCDKIINIFNKLEKNNSIEFFDQCNSTMRSDKSLNLQLIYDDLVLKCNQLIFDCAKNYINEYSILKKKKLFNPTLKVQKTISGGGFYDWHYESSNNYVSFEKDRDLVWMVYLNDDFEGGETEFLYYQKRIVPKKGTLLIWPPGFTHTHRGGMVIGGEKYIMTGWMYNIGISHDATEYIKLIGGDI